jgi:hypothetical protein
VTTEGKKSANADWVKWAGNQPPTRNTPLRDGKGTLYEGGTRVPLMWAWAGKIAPGTVSGAVVGPIDVYPTVLELLGVERPAGQVMDGASYAKVLRGKGNLERTAYFNYHPHAGQHRAGGVWVRSGKFKLLRWFGNPGSEELYDLEADLGETKDLAGGMPEKARELGKLIDGFLEETGAEYPRPNPAYRGMAAPGKPANGDPLEGWKERQCRATVGGGVLSLKGTGKEGTAFLGHGTGTMTGPAVVRLRVRSAEGGAGKIESLPRGAGEPGGGLEAAFEVKAGEWQELEIKLGNPGPLGTLRVYLPDAEVDWIEVAPLSGRALRSDFEGKR